MKSTVYDQAETMAELERSTASTPDMNAQLQYSVEKLTSGVLELREMSGSAKSQ